MAAPLGCLAKTIRHATLVKWRLSSPHGMQHAPILTTFNETMASIYWDNRAAHY